MGEVKRETPSFVDDDYTRAFIDGWNARLDHADFDMALHHWMLSQVTHIGTSPTSPETGLREAAQALLDFIGTEGMRVYGDDKPVKDVRAALAASPGVGGSDNG